MQKAHLDIGSHGVTTSMRSKGQTVTYGCTNDACHGVFGIGETG